MTASSTVSSIRAAGLLSDLAPEFVELLAAHARPRQVADNDVLFHYGEPARSFYLITSGRISVEVAAVEGPSLQLQDLPPGAVLGWSWVIPPHRWSFQARAEGRTQIIEFDGTAILAECETNPRFGYQLLRRFAALMSDRLQHARQRMIEEWRPEGFA
jgi:CRP/FNR family cyclic AMP-dependent transcriptional regulator